MHDRLTIPQVARELEVSERVIRRAVRLGTLEALEQRGQWGRLMFARPDVDTFGRIYRLGKHDRRARTVVTAHLAESGLQVTALRTAGLHVGVGSSILDALSQHDGAGIPVLIVALAMPPQELTLLHAIVADCHCIVVGDELDVEYEIASRATIIDEWELRPLVQTAWLRVDQRETLRRNPI